MLSLADLPTELLLSILQNIPSSRDKVHAGSTCKKLHQVARGLIYANISLEWGAAHANLDFTNNHETSPNSVTLLLRTLIEKPELGGLVKDLHLHGQSFSGRISWSLLTPRVCVDALDRNKVTSIIHDFQVPHAQEWALMARRGKMDAIVTLLLTFLPNLMRLRILSNFARETQILGLTLLSDIKASSSKSVMLPMRFSLEDVTVRRHRQGSGNVKEDNTAETLIWFYLPKVQSLNLAIDNPKAFAWPLEFPPYPSSLRSLTLAGIREPHAGEVFAVCNGLKQLEWSIDHYAEASQISEPLFDLDGVTTALGPLRESLEDLKLKTAVLKGPSDLEHPLVSIRGSLAIVDFLAVRKFTLSWPLAMGLEPNHEKRLGTSMPKNVQEITITSDGFDRSESFEWDEFSQLGPMEEFFTTYKKYTPFLEQFNMLVKYEYGSLNYRMIKEISYLCVEVGLRCRITHRLFHKPSFEPPPPGWVWRAPESWNPATSRDAVKIPPSKYPWGFTGVYEHIDAVPS